MKQQYIQAVNQTLFENEETVFVKQISQQLGIGMNESFELLKIVYQQNTDSVDGLFSLTFLETQNQKCQTMLIQETKLKNLLSNLNPKHIYDLSIYALKPKSQDIHFDLTDIINYDLSNDQNTIKFQDFKLRQVSTNKQTLPANTKNTQVSKNSQIVQNNTQKPVANLKSDIPIKKDEQNQNQKIQVEEDSKKEIKRKAPEPSNNNNSKSIGLVDKKTKKVKINDENDEFSASNGMDIEFEQFTPKQKQQNIIQIDSDSNQSDLYFGKKNLIQKSENKPTSYSKQRVIETKSYIDSKGFLVTEDVVNYKDVEHTDQKLKEKNVSSKDIKTNQQQTYSSKQKKPAESGQKSLMSFFNKK